MHALNMELHGHMTNFMLAVNILVGLPVIAAVQLGGAKVFNRTAPTNGTPSPITADQAIAGTIAYGYYIAAALMVGDHFSDFLRDHLFDGFAPAALVIILMFRIRNATLSTLRQLFFMYLQSAVVFGLIAEAAVFTSDKHNYVPVLYAALIGGFIFPLVARGTQPVTGGAAGDAGPNKPAKNDPGPGKHGVDSATEPLLADAPDQPASSPVTAEGPVF
jgi:hypothetical protein